MAGFWSITEVKDFGLHWVFSKNNMWTIKYISVDQQICFQSAFSLLFPDVVMTSHYAVMTPLCTTISADDIFNPIEVFPCVYVDSRLSCLCISTEENNQEFS